MVLSGKSHPHEHDAGRRLPKAAVDGEPIAVDALIGCAERQHAVVHQAAVQIAIVCLDRAAVAMMTPPSTVRSEPSNKRPALASIWP